MSATELVVEKVKQLSEVEAESVLAYIAQIHPTRAPSPVELMRLPKSERRRILAAQAEKAEALYREHPEIIMEDTEAPLDPG